MNIILNGKNRSFEGLRFISCLIHREETPKEGLVIMINDEIIPSNDWNSHFIKENDEIEMLCFVSGG